MYAGDGLLFRELRLDRGACARQHRPDWYVMCLCVCACVCVCYIIHAYTMYVFYHTCIYYVYAYCIYYVYACVCYIIHAYNMYMHTVHILFMRICIRTLVVYIVVVREDVLVNMVLIFMIFKCKFD